MQAFPRRLRRQGIMERLIAAAVEYGRGEGATAIEAYPVDSDSPSYRFMGFVSSFRKAGFKEVGSRQEHIRREPRHNRREAPGAT